MHSAGTLLPGQAVNAASILADEPEPFAVVVDSAEALVISLTAAELARVVSMPVMEQLKVMNLERLQWRLQLPTSSTPRSHGRAPRSSRADAPGKAVPNQELVRLDNVLHDRPEIVCQSPRQPPGIIQNIGKDMMTSSLSVRRPNMQMECPRVHPALIPHLKDLRLKAKPARPGSEDLTATATTETDLVTRSCDDWGLRSAAPPLAASLRRARSVRGMEESGDISVELDRTLSRSLRGDVKPKPEVVEVPSARVDTSVPLTRGNSKSSTGGWHADGRLAAAGRLARGCQPRSEQQAAMSATLGTTGIVEGDIPSSPSKSRKCQLPKAGSPGMEGNLRIASIEQFLQKGDNCWRGWGKLGRRTLTKLEDEQCCHVLPLL